jgi:hypothetical protein
MRRLTITLCAALLFTGINAYAQKDAKAKNKDVKYASSTETKKWVAVDSATAMKIWMEYMTPGKAHAMMATANGEWTGEITMWMTDGASPMKSIATATNTMLMGGRYQQSVYKGDFGGMPFEGMSLLAFDNAKQSFISSWIDNMGTGMMNMEGKYDEATKTIHFKGNMVCPNNGIECEVKETYKFIDNDTQVMEMWGPDLTTGKLYKNMEIRYTRKK